VIDQPCETNLKARQNRARFTIIRDKKVKEENEMAEQTVTLKLRVDDSGSILLDKFSGKLAEVPKHVDSMSRSLSLIKYDSIVNLGERALQTGERIYSMARSIVSGANEIGRMAQISGLSTDAFQKFAYAAKMSDVESESLATGIKLLAKNMEETSQGSGDAAKWFSVMGISVKDLNTGGLKPLDQMMGELADKFSGWEDGTRKIAIATALFGRSGEALIPMLNKGNSGLTDFYKEAERLGIILSPDMVRKGGEAEDAFKRFEAQLKTFKLSLSPVVSELTKYLGVLTDIVNKGKELAFPPMPKGPAYELTGEQKKLFSLWGIGVTQGEKIKRTPELWEIFGGEGLGEGAGKGRPPELPKEYPITKMGEDLWKSFKEGEGTIKIIQGDMVEMIPVIKDYESWWDKINADLDELRLKMKMVTPEGAQWTPFEPGLKPGMMTIGGTEWNTSDYAKLVESLQETKNLIATMGWEDYAAGLDASTEGTRKWTEMMLRNTKVADEMRRTEAFWDDITKSMANSFSSNFLNLVEGGFKDMGEFVKRFGMDALGIMEKLILNAAIFGNMMAEKNASGGYGGIIGWLTGLFGGGGGGGATSGVFNDLFNIRGYQSGGYIDRPQLAMLHGGEYVVPESKMGKGGGQTVINYFYIPAMDQQSVNDFFRRNSGHVIKIVKNDLDRNGILRKI
jgi:hypothetical protein